MDPMLAAILVVLGLLCGLAYVLGLSMSKRGEGMRDWLAMHTRHRRRAHQPSGRPLEAIVADVRRLGTRFYALDPHASYAKAEGIRTGYDRALAECCAALGLTHLLGVLPVGAERDAERTRVEGVLGDSGVRLPRAA